MKKRAGVLFISLLALHVLIPTHTAFAFLEGRTTVTSQITTNSMPTIQGTIPSWCSDVLVAIGTDQADTTTWRSFYSDYGEVDVIDNGYSNTRWSLNLARFNYGLVNGVYSVIVASECDYSGTYSNPLYADIHQGVISVVPNVCDVYCVPIYRFYNVQNGAHFYTTNEHEKRQVLGMAQYRFEGISNYAKYNRTSLPGMVPVHRFYHKINGTHFYTSNQSEASSVNNTQSHTYRYEGVAYYNIINR